MARFPVCRVLVAAALAAPALAGPLSTAGPAFAARPAAAPPALSPPAGPLTSAGPAASATPSRASLPPQPAALAADPTLELLSLTPAVARPGQAVVITGTLRNDDNAAALPRPTVRLVRGSIDSSREAVREWAAGTGPAAGTLLAQTRLPASVPPGASVPFRITVPNLASEGAATYGAMPLSVESGGAVLRTFAGYQQIKQYQPMSIAWAVPVTVDPDPNLFGATGSTREEAWSQALSDGSRVSRVLEATQDAPVTWAIDPTLTPSLLPEPVDVGDASTQESSLRTATEARLTAAATRHTPWVLPDTDADIGAAAGLRAGEGLMRTLVGRAAPVAKALGGRADIAWPADGTYTSTGETGLRRVFGAPSLAGEVVSGSFLPMAPSGATPGAAQRSASGLPLLAYDDVLSGLLARTTSRGDGALSTQQFVAESAALLNELPGTAGRSVLVVAPRSFNPDPDAGKAFFAAAASIPWLTPTTTDAQLAAARRAAPTTSAPVTRPTRPSTPTGQPVLTAVRVRDLQATVRTVRGVAQIRDDGDEFARIWTRAAEQLSSTRWRSARTAWNTLSGRVTAAGRQTTTAVKVSASTVNFLAESGRLQITVTNDLDVPVENVKLTVEASNPRLRIDSQPPTLRIGPRSRATVNISVTALAAGPVPLRTTLTTPDGTVIGQGADVQVRVTPTGDWVYWALGGVAGGILVIGIVRSFRRRPGRPITDTLPVEARG